MSGIIADSIHPNNQEFPLTFVDKRNLAGMYLCVLVKGTLPSGQSGYAFFGVFADVLVKFLRTNPAGKPFNPKDLKAMVLARSSGELSPEIAEFMKYKFSFTEDHGILEISRS